MGRLLRRPREAGADTVRFHCGDAFTIDLPGPYDLVYDSGCFHHLPPHRRISYRALLDRVLAPGGHLGLLCFAAGAVGSELPDEELYRHGRLDGGLAYTPESLRWIFADLDEVELRRMSEEVADSPHFGVPFLWTALFRRSPSCEGAGSHRRGTSRRRETRRLGPMTTISAPPLRQVVGWAAVLGTVPYLALKFAWLSGSTVGVVDTAKFDDTSVFVLNAVTAAMDAMVIVIAMAFTYGWGQRLPAFLVLVPIWVATGFLVPIVLLLPLTGAALGGGDPLLESWVRPVVYGGFGWQGVTLGIAFVLYARVRWPWLFHVERLPVRPVAVVLGDLGAVLGAVAGVLWLFDGSVADRLLGGLAVLAAGGALVLVHGVRTRFWVPVVITWIGAGAMFAWGSWSVVNKVGETALSGGGGVPVGHLLAVLGGGLIGVGSLVLLSGHASATGGARSARP